MNISSALTLLRRQSRQDMQRRRRMRWALRT
nr:MAG TPA: hypothetical protein [Bacteriophage sp.]